MLNRLHVARADNDVGLVHENRFDEAGNISTTVLIIGIGVHDDICSELQRCIQPGGKRFRQPLMMRKPDNMMDAVLTGHFDGTIRAAVVHDQQLDDVDTGNLAR